MPASDGTRRNYEDLAPTAQLGVVAGLSVQVVGLDELVASKEWANRPKDRDALPELRSLTSKVLDE